MTYFAITVLILLITIALTLWTDYASDLDGPIKPKIKHAERLAFSGAVHLGSMPKKGR